MQCLKICKRKFDENPKYDFYSYNKNRIQPYIAIIGKTNFLKPQIRINQKF